MIGRLFNGLKKAVHGLRYGESLEPDETVVLFPQCASRIGGNRWRVPLHGWVVELEQGSISRRLGQHGVLGALDLLDVVEDQIMTDEYRQRLNWFMADREMNKRLQFDIGQQSYISPRSPPNGHIKFTVEFETAEAAGSIIDYRVADHPPGQFQLVDDHGLSVISDIDDTIKISNVTDKKQLVKGFFFDDYHVVPGMPELYHQIQQQHDACFHYVSASPWQLYPSLAPLLKDYYPFGSLSQRHFYVADRTFVQFFMSSKEYKINAIIDIMQRFPHRQYLLVGDSGERDAEVYAEVASQCPQQVCAIYIRRVDNDFSDVEYPLPGNIHMQYFSHPEEIVQSICRLTGEASSD